MSFSARALGLLPLLSLLLLQACGDGQDVATTVATVQDAGGGVPTAPYYHAEIEDALGFTIDYGENYKVLTVFSHWDNPDNATYHREYLLLPAGVEPPTAYAHLPVIRTPIKSLVTTSPTQSALLDPLDAEDILVGHSNDDISDPDVDQAIEDGRITVVGRTANLNVERVLALNPDVFMSGASLTEGQAAYSIFEENGIAVIPNAEYLEADVLGRAEWIKLMGILLDKEEQAEAFYDEMKGSYLALKALAGNVQNKPLVLAGAPNRGIWYQPAGGSYVAQMIVDAGGDYPWSHVEGVGSFSVSLEEMLQLGLRADVWMNPSVNMLTLADIAAADARLADLRPYKLGEVYAFDRLVDEEGANDYWESGVIYPNRILADLIRILHPELLPDYTLYYYRKFE